MATGSDHECKYYYDRRYRVRAAPTARRATRAPRRPRGDIGGNSPVCTDDKNSHFEANELIFNLYEKNPKVYIL